MDKIKLRFELRNSGLKVATTSGVSTCFGEADARGRLRRQLRQQQRHAQILFHSRHERGVELNSRLALIPVLNVSLVSKEILSGTYHWNHIALIFGSTCFYAAVALTAAVAMFKRESVLFRT